jgi:hypothetical protein
MPGWLMLVWLLVFLWMIGYFVVGYNMMVTNYKYTYLEPYYAPGKLTNERWTPTFITQYLLFIFRFIGILLTLVRLAFWKHPWAINFHIMFMLIFVLILECANTILLGLEIPDCNEDIQDNLCNDYRWCGVHAMNSTNGTCANTFPGTEPLYGTPLGVYNFTPAVTADDLKWNDEFLTSFVMALIMLVVSCLILILSFLSRSSLRAYVTQTELLAGDSVEGSRVGLNYKL